MTAAPLLLITLFSLCGELPAETTLPEKVSLLPVFFVPRGEPLPTPDQERG